MYKAFYEMQRLPFVRDIPPEKLYESPAMEETLGRLSYAADRGMSTQTIILMGVELLKSSADKILHPEEVTFGILPLVILAVSIAKRQLQKEVEIVRGVQGKKVVCILDEAHLLERETIEEFRFLLNYRFDSMSPMALVLVGQTELWDKLRLQRYAAVRQRIDLSCILPHLDRAETERYIQSHLEYAGGRQDIFTDKAVDEIYRESTGIPRRINRICDRCLMYASQQGKRLTDEHQVKFVVEHEMLGGGV